MTAPRVYDLDAFRRELSGTIYADKLHYFEETPSTNTVAMEAAAAGAEEGTVFLTNQQTAGRGRGGHDWKSEPGTAILVSLVLRPRIAPIHTLWLSLMTGVAVHEALLTSAGIRCDLRWPNDLLVGTRKVCGILTEVSADIEHVRHAVTGIGINVNQTAFPPELSELATSLRIAGEKELSRAPILVSVLKALEGGYKRLRADLDSGVAPSLLQRLDSASTWIRGKRVHVDEAGGYAGITDGLDERGFLRVRTENGLRTVLSGGVRAAT